MSFLLALAACTEPELASDYALRVVPRFLEGQVVLDDGPEIKVVVRKPNGDEEVWYAGTASSGAELSLPNLGPLPAGTLVGLLAEASGSTDAAWQPTATVAYGQVELDRGLATGEKQVEVEVLVARLDELAKLGNQPSAKRRHGGAIAMLPNGDTYLFGGGDPDSFGATQSKNVLALTGRNQGGTTFENVGTIPSFDAVDSGVAQPARAGMSATTIEVDGQAMIFVAGGRGDWLDPWDNVDGWFVWDPTAQGVNKQGKMASGRSEHLALPFGNGDVLLWGGIDGQGSPNDTHERFDVSDLRVREGRNADRLAIEPFKAFGSTLQGDIVVCGGYDIEGGFSTLEWRPADGCNRFQSDDDVEAFDPLPLPLAGAALVELSNGRLLLTGGATETLVDEGTDFDVAPSLPDAWIHDGGGWRPAGAMAAARSGHAMVLMADGRVLIVGGTEEAAGLYGDVQGPVRCPEVFDPTDLSFTQLECTNVGRGASPLVAWAPGQQAIVIEGYFSDGVNFTGAAEWGTISLGPPLGR